ncbi:hypothetical protein [Bacillus sp. M6-12]|uniref:hypothetical protein n=1 Tax=Bacillus sp. M6-12 TaxID=2054166 RepID=UPI00115B844D|nr:hypothetical protein [Bacillus sp. M6-12]
MSNNGKGLNQSKQGNGKNPPGEDFARDAKQNGSQGLKKEDFYEQMGDNPEGNKIKKDNEKE